MARMQYKIYRRQSRRRKIRQMLLALLMLTAAVILVSRWRSLGALTVKPVVPPTATPVSAGFDQTADSRTVTLPASVWYALQTGIYTDETAALRTAAQYADRGAPGYVLAQDGKYRVLIACYGSKDDAESVRTRLSERQSVETYVYEWPCTEVSMQMSGMAGQLDVAEAALSLLDDTASQLRELAIGCDKSEYTFDEAIAAVSGIMEQISLVSDTLSARFPKPLPAFVATLTSQLSQSRTLLDPLFQCETMTDFSARLKLQSMALRQQLIALRTLLLDM